MKKLLIVTLTLGLFLSFTSCDKEPHAINPHIITIDSSTDLNIGVYGDVIVQSAFYKDNKNKTFTVKVTGKNPADPIHVEEPIYVELDEEIGGELETRFKYGITDIPYEKTLSLTESSVYYFFSWQGESDTAKRGPYIM